MPTIEEIYRVTDVTEPLDDPRSSELFEGQAFMLGETEIPHPRYPGWERTEIQTESTDRSSALFALAPNTSSPVLLIERPLEMTEGQFPIIEEYPVQGSGWLLVQVPDGRFFIERIEEEKRRKVRYTERTCVAYFADGEGLVGVTTGKPPGVQETPLEDGDQRVCQEFWDLFRRIKHQR